MSLAGMTVLTTSTVAIDCRKNTIEVDPKRVLRSVDTGRKPAL
jgi:hypothetical protein